MSKDKVSRKRSRGAAYNEYMRHYLRDYYKKHPDKRLQYDIQQAVRLLMSHGYTVTRSVIKPVEGGAKDV